MPSRFPQRWVFAILILAVCAFRLATLRPGQDWGGDFAQYVAHAKSLAEGRPYSETNYIYNPDYPQVGPPNYPPALPVLLAPIVALRGLDLEAMKVLINLLLVASLAVYGRLWRNVLRPWQMAVWIALMGMNPVWHEYGNAVLSDIPYMFFAGVALVLTSDSLARAASTGDDPAGPRYLAGRLWLRAVLLAAAVFVATATRSIGVVLIPVMLFSSAGISRDARRLAAIAAVLAGAMIVPLTLALGTESSYTTQLTGLIPAVARNLRGYPPFLCTLWRLEFDGLPPVAPLIPFLLLASLGYVVRLLQRPRVTEFYVAGYLGIVLVWPTFQGGRLLLPLLPFLPYYVFVGIDAAGRIFRRPARFSIAIGLLFTLLSASSFALVWRGADMGPIPDGATTPAARALFEWVKTNTDEADAVAFRKPRPLGLFADRRALAVPFDRTDDQQRELFCREGVSWAIDAGDHWVRFPDDPTDELTGLARRHPDWFEEAVRIDPFVVCRFVGCDDPKRSSFPK